MFFFSIRTLKVGNLFQTFSKQPLSRLLIRTTPCTRIYSNSDVFVSVSRGVIKSAIHHLPPLILVDISLKDVMFIVPVNDPGSIFVVQIQNISLETFFYRTHDS